MIFDPNLHHRKSIRLKEYDYSKQGGYFITICLQNKQKLLGEILDQKMNLNGAGKMAQEEIVNLPERFPEIEIGEFIVMPNHIHLVIFIVDKTTETIGTITGILKSIITHKYTQGVKNNNWPRFNKTLFQRNFYEHVIRNEKDLETINEYIFNNPAKWLKDEFYH